MDSAEALGVMLYGIIALALLVLGVLFIYWQAKFLNEVPRLLQNIAETLEKIAKK